MKKIFGWAILIIILVGYFAILCIAYGVSQVLYSLLGFLIVSFILYKAVQWILE